MAYAFDILARLEALSIKDEVSMIAEDNEGVFADADRDQLLHGKDRFDNYLPTYAEDPFFKGDIKRIQGYINYKNKVHPNPLKPEGIRDYFINGFTHNSITAEVRGLDLEIKTGVDWNENLESVDALGLSPENASTIWNNVIHPELMLIIHQKTGL